MIDRELAMIAYGEDGMPDCYEVEEIETVGELIEFLRENALDSTKVVHMHSPTGIATKLGVALHKGVVLLYGED